MGSALFTGISGLNASSKELDVIANNLANVNTIGFKSNKTFFADVLSSSLSGGSSGTVQVGRGVSVTQVQTQFGAGSFESTGNATDVAIDGDGFFMVNDNQGATYYTRAGSFHLDNNGLLVDTNNYRVQGQIVVNGEPSGPLTDINLREAQSQPVVTTRFALGSNLNSGTAAGGQYNTTQTVYDSLGAKHTLNTTFTKTENSTAGYWSIQAALDADPATAISADGMIFDSNGNLTEMYTGSVGAVTPSGAGTATINLQRPGMIYQTDTLTLTRGVSAAVWNVTGPGGYANATVSNVDTINNTVSVSLDGTGTADLILTLAGGWAAGDTASFTVTHATQAVADVIVDFSGIPLNNGATIGNGGNVAWNLTGGNALDITQYASASVIRAVNADGYGPGQLKSISIDTSGLISGFFTNGQTSELAQIILASFPSPTGLMKMGANLFAETVLSGSSIRNMPGESGTGTLTPNTLEMSNTDIATEFIKMITAQKAYQSNARVITTQDTIMQELMNLKR
jgi:flagellar hook protein FlgE